MARLTFLRNLDSIYDFNIRCLGREFTQPSSHFPCMCHLRVSFIVKVAQLIQHIILVITICSLFEQTQKADFLLCCHRLD